MIGKNFFEYHDALKIYDNEPLFFELTYFRGLGRNTKKSLSFFGSNENFEICFWNLLTFRYKFCVAKLTSIFWLFLCKLKSNLSVLHLSVILKPNYFKKQCFSFEVDIQVKNDHGVLSRLISYIKEMGLGCSKDISYLYI